MIARRHRSSGSLHPAARWLAPLLACVTAACSEGAGGVTRMADGVRYEGRFINPEAYAAYAIGVEHEAHGEYGKAISAYSNARAEDPESPEIWARIGAVQCFAASAQAGPAASAHAFGSGLALDSSYYGNFFERARCEERARDLRAALTDATAAVLRRPGDEPANLLVARLLRAQGQGERARAWLEALQAFREISPATTRVLDAARSPAPVQPPRTIDAPKNPALTPARSRAFTELRLGRLEAARQHAQIELAADPTNSDAWIATLVACDALRDDECFDSALGSLKSPSLAPSDTALALLNELLTRRTSAKFAR